MKPNRALPSLAALLPLIAQAHPGHPSLHENHTHLLVVEPLTLAVAALALLTGVVVGWRYRRSWAAKRR